jgi:ABC-type phosphate/phosphonate transport system permease subunit
MPCKERLCHLSSKMLNLDSQTLILFKDHISIMFSIIIKNLVVFGLVGAGCCCSRIRQFEVARKLSCVRHNVPSNKAC